MNFRSRRVHPASGAHDAVRVDVPPRLQSHPRQDPGGGRRKRHPPRQISTEVAHSAPQLCRGQHGVRR